MKTSIIVAAYNEEAVIARSVEAIIAQLEKCPELAPWELICVDDGSRDGTGRILDELGGRHKGLVILHHRRNFGQGRALRSAFDIASGEVVVTLDADLSYGPEYILSLISALGENDAEIALASAYMKGGSVSNVPLYRRILSRVGNAYLARMSQYKIATSTCVVRAYRREVLDSVHLTSDGMELQLEILMKASFMGFRVCEIPADLSWKKEGVTRSGLTRASKMRILQTIRVYLWLGWLSRPALVFAILSIAAIAPGTYMALVLLFRLFQRIVVHVDKGLNNAVSAGLQDVFSQYTYSVAFCLGLLLIGLQVLASSMQMLQNKFYFEELYRLGQTDLQRQARMRRGG